MVIYTNNYMPLVSFIFIHLSIYYKSSCTYGVHEDPSKFSGTEINMVSTINFLLYQFTNIV